ncbi:MAG: hypothetical protein AB7D05_03680 [Mangrovibacterium sp.]
MVLEPIFSSAAKSGLEVSPLVAAGSSVPLDGTKNRRVLYGRTEKQKEGEHKKPVKRLIRKRGSGYTPSIKDALSGRLETKVGPADAREKMKYYTGEALSRPFTREEFEQKWKAFLAQLHDRPNLRSTLSRIPEIGDRFRLCLKIENSVQEEEIGKIKPELVSWLRRELQNTHIELITEIVVQEIESKPYSETEKLAEMIKKNSNIGLLRQKFNLDFGEI